MVANRKPGCLVKAEVPGYAIALPRRKLLRETVSEDHMTPRNHRFLVRLAASAALGLTLAGCTALGTEEFQRGYLLDTNLLAQVKPGMGAEQVLNIMGTPSTVSTVGNRTWYYISQTSRRTFQFTQESVVDQKVTAIYFNPGLRVERVALYGLQEGRVFDFISRTTPTGGQEANFLGQVLKGTNSFNPFGS
jgi:outer membrane protein assembly factor BamE (lipoprotein component of BamABCDE complex)